jgi:2-amino-4-hydroxy-6-hydroxymethyldihydropteridine diphosphokinase
MQQQNLVFLGLGTNLGDRQQQLQDAVTALGQILTVDAISHVYETEPWGDLDQPQFLNICLAAITALKPHDLLCAIKTIEQDLGRRATRHWGPRVIDIDILFFSNLIIDTPDLKIPHPHIAARAFVLVPLADIAPNLIHPQSHQSIDTMLRSVERGTVRRISGKLTIPEPPTERAAPCEAAEAEDEPYQYDREPTLA